MTLKRWKAQNYAVGLTSLPQPVIRDPLVRTSALFVCKRVSKPIVALIIA